MQQSEFDIESAGDDARELVLVGAAFKAGIFSALSMEKDIASLKHELQADERALYIIIEALSSLGYVDKKKDRYIIADRARPYLLEQGEEYVGGYLPHLLDILEAWLKLPDIIRGARPEREKHDVGAFMHAMASRPDTIVEDVVTRCLERKKDAKTVLDLGGGPGRYSRAFIRRGLVAVLYDMPEVIEYVRAEFELDGIKNLVLKKGDFTESDFVREFSEPFDIVFMGNICHIYSAEENRLLIKRVKNLLGENGLIAIEDFVRGRSPDAEMFAVNMLANTESGGTWTEAQYGDWLESGGFSDIEVIDLAMKEKQLITAFMR